MPPMPPMPPGAAARWVPDAGAPAELVSRAGAVVNGEAGYACARAAEPCRSRSMMPKAAPNV